MAVPTGRMDTNPQARLKHYAGRSAESSWRSDGPAKSFKKEPESRQVSSEIL